MDSDDDDEFPRATLKDLNVLDCPICFGPLISPVYQCINGHTACAPCCTKMANKCLTCRLRIGTIRCRAIEEILELVTVKCRNTLYGCTQTFKHNEKLDHEKICQYYPCTCPYDKCTYVGMPKPLYKHFGQLHSHIEFSFNTVKSISLDASQTQVFLQDSRQSTLFILKRTVVYPGSFVSVTCVAQDSQCRAFSYDLTVVIDRDTHVKIKAGVVCTQKWTVGGFSRKSLALPSALVDPKGKLDLELILRRN